MKALRFTYIVLGSLILLFLVACAAEDGDLTAPVVTINGVESPRSDPSVFLSGTVEVGAFVIVDVALPPFGSGVVTNLTQGNGLWSCTISGMSDQVNTIYITATDSVGNTRFLQTNIEVDTTGPTVTLDQFTTPTPNGSQVLAGTVSDLDASDVLVSTDGGGSWFSVDDINGGIWTYAVNLLVGATYNVQVKGLDKLLNETDPAEYVTALIDVDAAADSIAVTEAALGPVYVPTPNDTSTLLLNGTRTSDYSVAIVNISPVSSVTIDDAADSVAWTSDFLALPAGNTVVDYGLNDLAMLEVAQAKIMVIRDQSGPVLIDRLPVHGDQNVPASDPLVLTFSETMNSIVNDGTFINLVDENDNIVTFSTDPTTSDDRTFSFVADPSTPILSNTKYTVNFLISSTMTVTDVYENLFIRPTDLWTFSTQ